MAGQATSSLWAIVKEIATAIRSVDLDYIATQQAMAKPAFLAAMELQEMGTTVWLTKMQTRI